MLKAVCQNTLPFHSHRKITTRFDGGSLTSDAGWLLFGSLDRQHRLCEGFSSCIAESRDRRYVRHDLLKLIRQRVLQIVAGYEDCNDADTLRSDPMLKTVCDQLPESDLDLATQPTFSRLENSVTKKDLMRLSRWLLGRYVRSLKKRHPGKIILDLDSTDDHTHGQQEFSFYHGYYRNHILHPLLIFDAATGDLVCAVLRPGNKGAASHIVPVLKRVVEAIRQAVGTDVEIEIRADSGFATPRLYEFCECEENKLQYVIGLSRNPRLQRVVEPLLDSTRLRFVELEEKQRQFDEFLYRAHSWDRSRRVIVKVEVDQRGINRRFVVTNRDDLCSQSLYDHYTNRGQTENFIKAFKNHLSMDRLSCHRFLANQFRLLLHALAYQMFVRLRDYLHGTPWHKLVPAFALSAILLGAGGLAQIREGQVRPQEKIQVQALLQEKLRFAASQHEIVTLLIDDGRFEEAEAGYYELLDLRFSGPQEKLLVQSVWKIVEKLRNAGQHEVAHRIVAGTLRELAQLENRHTLLILRAKLYQEQGSLSKALETLRQAKALVSSE